MLGAKFRLDVGIMLENNRVLTEQRGALKEQLSETNKMYNQQIEYYNRDQSFIEHQNNEIRKMEPRLAEAEKVLKDICHHVSKDCFATCRGDWSGTACLTYRIWDAMHPREKAVLAGGVPVNDTMENKEALRGVEKKRDSIPVCGGCSAGQGRVR